MSDHDLMNAAARVGSESGLGMGGVSHEAQYQADLRNEALLYAAGQLAEWGDQARVYDGGHAAESMRAAITVLRRMAGL